jgi:hypothetical protein
MSREMIEVGAFTWSRIQRLYDPDAIQHWQRCDEERLKGGPEPNARGEAPRRIIRRPALSARGIHSAFP